MSQYDNTNRGAIWGNDKKESEKHPDFKGSINVEGQEYWLSGWKRDLNGNPKAPALSLAVTKKEVQQQASGTGPGQFAPSQTPPTQPQATQEFEKDIPFANPYKRKEYLL